MALELQKKRLLESGDVELNPGPRNDAEPEKRLILVTQNCRGISEDKKFRHLLNNCYKISKESTNFIIALQETMITEDQKLRYGWRGSHIFTPGTGHGRGCVTLLPSHIQPDFGSVTHLNDRGHIFKATMGQQTLVIANIYSPTGHSREKIEFFRKVQRDLTTMREPLDDVYLMGDFNTIFESSEATARSFSNQEQRHSAQIKRIIDTLALESAWENDRVTHTWRQPGTRKSSRLDRVYYQNSLRKISTETDWTFTISDHAAVITKFVDSNPTQRQKILRLNPDLLDVKDSREAFLQEYNQLVQQTPPSWDPHQKLEFHKCAMRSAYIKIKKEMNKRKKSDYDFLKEDLHTHIKILEESKHDISRANRVMQKINRLKAEITKLNLQRGQKLANRLKTKWYNEGEKSNKYFFALLRKKDLNGQLKEIQVENRVETDPEKN